MQAAPHQSRHHASLDLSGFFLYPFQISYILFTIQPSICQPISKSVWYCFFYIFIGIRFKSHYTQRLDASVPGCQLLQVPQRPLTDIPTCWLSPPQEVNSQSIDARRWLLFLAIKSYHLAKDTRIILLLKVDTTVSGISRKQDNLVPIFAIEF